MAVWLISTLVRLTWDEDSYKIFDPSRVPDGTVDIPKQVQNLKLFQASTFTFARTLTITFLTFTSIVAQFRSYANYCASLAHKTNHSFVPNRFIFNLSIPPTICSFPILHEPLTSFYNQSMSKTFPHIKSVPHWV